MTKLKPLGQIAYRAYRGKDYATPWDCLTNYEQDYWMRAASAVAREVKRRGKKK